MPRAWKGPELESMKDDLRSLNGQVGRCFEISRRYLRFLNREAAESSSSSVLQILKDLRELLIRHPAAAGHTLLVHEPQTEIVARVNGTDFLQILLNLTINALQACETPHAVEVRAFLLEVPMDASRFIDGPDRTLHQSERLRERPSIDWRSSSATLVRAFRRRISSASSPSSLPPSCPTRAPAWDFRS